MYKISFIKGFYERGFMKNLSKSLFLSLLIAFSTVFCSYGMEPKAKSEVKSIAPAIISTKLRMRDISDSKDIIVKDETGLDDADKENKSPNKQTKITIEPEIRGLDDGDDDKEATKDVVVTEVKLPNIMDINTILAGIPFGKDAFCLKAEPVKTDKPINARSIAITFRALCIGHIDYAIVLNHSKYRPGLYIHNIKIIDSKYQGLGLGYFLALAACIDGVDHLKTCAINSAFITTISKESFNLFHKIGFRQTPGLGSDHLATTNLEALLKNNIRTILVRVTKKLTNPKLLGDIS